MFTTNFTVQPFNCETMILQHCNEQPCYQHGWWVVSEVDDRFMHTRLVGHYCAYHTGVIITRLAGKNRA